MQQHEIETFYPTSRQKWRQWLQKHHDKKQAVWMEVYKKDAGKPTISWSDAVDEALCFGWIDSKRITVDDEKFMQFFSKRKAGGTWSKINKEKILRLIDEGLMGEAGLQSIKTAKQDGSWEILDEVEELIVPKDLEKTFKAHAGSKAFYLSLSKSVRKRLLLWIVLAKRPETRQKRIDEIAWLAARQQLPKHM